MMGLSINQIKKNGYELVDGKKYTGIGIKPQKVGIKPKSNTHSKTTPQWHLCGAVG